MLKVKFSELSTLDADVCFIGAAKAIWKDERRYVQNLNFGRSADLLYYQISGKRNYYKNDKLLLTLNPGEGIFIPTGALYYSELTDCESSEGIYIDFKLKNATDQIYIDAPFYIIKDERLRRRFEAVAENRSDKMRVKAEIYRLLSEISSIAVLDGLTTAQRAVREKMLEICRHPELPADTSKLAHECHMSETGFRILFKECSNGLSPREYRNKMRIELADELISTGRFKVQQVVDMLGFCDSSHYYKFMRDRKDTKA